MELFKIILPSNRVENAERMYYRSENAHMVYEENGNSYLRMAMGDRASFDTYFNLFSYQKYKRYTNVRTVRAVLKYKGKIKVSLLTHKTWKNARGGYVTEEIESKIVESATGDLAEIVWDFSKERRKSGTVDRWLSSGEMEYDKVLVTGFAYLEVTALSDDACIYGGYYSADEVEQNPVKLAIGICTFKREEYVINNVQMISKELTDNPESSVYGALDVLIADNGQTLKGQIEESEHIHLFDNPNYGGSGGFTRTLMEAWYRRDEFTHILLMDDDVVIEPNILIKTINFLRVLAPKYANLHVGGAMLHITNPYFQYEMGSFWNGNEAKSYNRYDVSRVDNLIRNEEYPRVNFNGWFYNCMPISVIEKHGLPFPFFIKGDDIEYSIRTSDTIVMLNGIGVWHEPYVAKYSSHLAYFDYRNKLVVSAVHTQRYDAKAVKEDLKKRVSENLYRYQYDRAEFCLLAMEDFLKGVDFFLNQEEDKYLGKLLSMREGTFLTEKELKKKKVYFDQNLFDEDKEPKKGFASWIDSITCNGNLLPKCFFSNELQITDFGKYEPEAYRRRKRVLEWSPIRNKGMLCVYDKKRFLKLKWRLIKLGIKVRFSYNKVAKEYVDRTGEITSLSYWEKHLGLPSTTEKEKDVVYTPPRIVRKSKGRLFRERMHRVFTTEVHRRDYVDVAYGNIMTFCRKVLRRLHLTGMSKKMTNLQQFKDIHKGKRCFIVCTGPSLRMSDLEMLKGEYTFGVNSIFNAYEQTDWRPTYYVMCDASGYRRQVATWDFESFAKEKVFLNERILQWQKGFTDKTVGFVFNHRTSEHYKAPTLPMKYEKDIDVCIYDRCTVTNAAIDIALYMGFKEIYLIGVDHNYTGQRHFVATEDDQKRKAPSIAHVKLSEDGYRMSESHAKRRYAKVYNATRGGKLEVFPRAKLSTLFNKKK